MYGRENWTTKKAEHWRTDAFELWCWRRLLRVPRTARRSNQSILNIHWKDWCWSWSPNTSTTWCEELSPWKRPWCWQKLKAGEEDNRGWDGWMAPLTRWTWIWAWSGSWWWTWKPGVLQSMGLQKVEHDWVTELNFLPRIGSGNVIENDMLLELHVKGVMYMYLCSMCNPPHHWTF